MDEKSGEMSELAKTYYQDADELGKAAKGSKRWMIILAAIVVIVIITGVVIYFVEKN